MKIFLGVILIMSIVGAYPVTAAPAEKDIEVIDGGRTKEKLGYLPGGATKMRYELPTAISSSEIVSFSLEAHPFAYVDWAKPYNTFSLKLKKTGDSVTGKMITAGFRSLGASKKEYELNLEGREGAELFKTLAELIEKYELSKNNGSYSFVHGLPDNIGGVIEVLYASDEKLYLSDNQGMPFPFDFLKDVMELVGAE